MDNCEELVEGGEYKGEIILGCDGPSNLGVIAEVMSYVNDCIRKVSGDISDEDKEHFQNGVKIALGKLKTPKYEPKMVWNNFDVDCLIGEGSFGKIWKADFFCSDSTTKQVAIKQMATLPMDIATIWKERDILILVKHRRICNLLGSFVHRDVFLVMELCYGSVAKLKLRIDDNFCARFSKQLLEAVAWIHSKNIIHADIKADNCLIDRKNELVLGDFGSALIITGEKKMIHMPCSHGSPGYMDLEANRDLVFSKHTDVFSAACVIFEMDVKKHLLYYPFQDGSDRNLYIDALVNGRLKKLICGASPPSTPIGSERETLFERAYSSRFYQLIRKMIAPHEGRISAEEALMDSTLRYAVKAASDSLKKKRGYVTREYNVDLSVKFEFFGRDTAINPAFLGFYYDKNAEDAAAVPTTPGIDEESSCSNDDEMDND